MNVIDLFGFNISVWIYIPVFYLMWVTLLLLLKRLSFHYIRKFTRQTATKIDNILVQAADFPVTLLIFTSGGAIAEKMMPVTAGGQMTDYFTIGFKATTVVAIVLFADRLINGLFKIYSEKIEILKSSGGVARGIVRAMVIGLGLLILMDSFGVSVTPLIASLGISSLAVALALQPTLENFFAGVQIVMDKSIQAGQFIKLESGEEGYVHKIGWRSTWLKMLSNNVVVIPNKVLVSSRIVNYYYPTTDVAVLVEVGVHYGSDLEHVERVTIEVAEEVMKTVAGAVADFKPFIRYHTFADFSINFTVILRAQEFVANYLIKHEFIKRLHKRYAQEGIVIPFPIEAVNLGQEEMFQKIKERE